MKRFMLLSLTLFVMLGCAKELNDSPPPQVEKENSDFGSIYGIATLDESGQPSTRGVANGRKIWGRPVAAEHLTVKFLNGDQEYKDYVKEVVKDWEKAGGVRFRFVDDSRDALIRVGFDYIEDMKTSWAYTGTDQGDLYDKQNEPTIHFAEWPRASDNKKRSDVLRAFGQALGLELEFRHPAFWPAWIVDSNGNIDEAKIKKYWEKELRGVVEWKELKKMVLDPLSRHTFIIHKTEHYDGESVMVWPFFQQIANNIQPIRFDSQYNTVLSETDKAFIDEIYGPTFGGVPPHYFNLIEFDHNGTSAAFSITTTKNLMVIWDKEAKDVEFINMPTDTTSVYTIKVLHKYIEAKQRKIIIAEVLDYEQDRPDESRALLDFSMYLGNTAKNVDIKVLNKALKRVFLEGSTSNFAPQSFNFTGFEALKELYLVQIQDSKVKVESCQALEIFSTSRNLYYPKNMSGTPSFTPNQNAMINPGDFIVDTMHVFIPKRWPEVAERYHSFSEAKTSGLEIVTCVNIKAISLENTRLENFDFNKFENLEYVYLSSTNDYLACGHNDYGSQWQYLYPYGEGALLEETIARLSERKAPKPTGNIIVRNVEKPDSKYIPLYYSFIPVRLHSERFERINTNVVNKNWKIIWDSGYELIYGRAIPFEPTE